MLSHLFNLSILWLFWQFIKSMIMINSVQGCCLGAWSRFWESFTEVLKKSNFAELKYFDKRVTALTL